jgi:NADPH-dependent 2,4-dienoyl-CoA reductase/sulfur reductase-like enzyme
MADALTHRGLSVPVVEHHAWLLKTIDASFGQLVSAELQRHGVQVVSGVGIERIERDGRQLYVTGSADFRTSADLVLVGVGVRP